MMAAGFEFLGNPAVPAETKKAGRMTGVS